MKVPLILVISQPCIIRVIAAKKNIHEVNVYRRFGIEHSAIYNYRNGQSEIYRINRVVGATRESSKSVNESVSEWEENN